MFCYKNELLVHMNVSTERKIVPVVHLSASTDIMSVTITAALFTCHHLVPVNDP